MRNDSIYYIGHYDTDENEKENRNYSYAARNKMDYISGNLIDSGYSVEIISPSKTRKKNYFKGKYLKINEKKSLKLFPTFPWGNKLQKLFSLVASDLLFFIYLLYKIKKNQNVLVYHSMELRNIVFWAKKIKKFNLILEVEEIYQDIGKYSKKAKKNEYKILKNADKYIFSTELLNGKINHFNKPHTVIYGTYQLTSKYNASFNDEKIHVVYAGTFSNEKGGALAAITATEFLTENYHVHIIGFGKKEENDKIQSSINEVRKKSEASISFDGLLKGKDYELFLQKCQIGLSTQMPEAIYNNSSFPSKILSYMSNGLRVVSANIEVVKKSAIGEKVYYYLNQNPQSIAETIMSINIESPYDSRKLIGELNNQFTKNIDKLMKS